MLFNGIGGIPFTKCSLWFQFSLQDRYVAAAAIAANTAAAPADANAANAVNAAAAAAAAAYETNFDLSLSVGN